MTRGIRGPRINFFPRRDFTGRVNLGCVLRLVPGVSGAWVTIVAVCRVRPGWRGRRLPPCQRGLPGGAVCLAERAAGRRAGTGEAGECGDYDAPGQPGEEQGCGQAVGGDLVVAAVRDAALPP
jgi:hypothetical protein